MANLTIQDVSRRSGLSEPTLRYYETVGLIGPIARDARSGHRRYLPPAQSSLPQNGHSVRETRSLTDSRCSQQAWPPQAL
jgi:hypothetical protein